MALKISIVIPSFNDERIVTTIKSIEVQEPGEFCTEIIVMDGGSSPSIQSKIRQALPDNSTFVSEADNGIFDGINKGIERASGDLILTLGTDDRIADSKLFKKVSRSHKNGANLIFCGLAYTDEQWREIRRWPPHKFTRTNYLIGRQFAHFGMFCSKEIYQVFGCFNTGNRVNADYEFFHKLLSRSDEFEFDVDYIASYSIQMKLGGNSSQSIFRIFSHNLGILKYLLRHDPLLIPGQLLKPFHKLFEFHRALTKRN